MRKLQTRWSRVSFRSFREVSRGDWRGANIENVRERICFRIFRIAGNFGKLIFPPYRGKETLRRPTEGPKFPPRIEPVTRIPRKACRARAQLHCRETRFNHERNNP